MEAFGVKGQDLINALLDALAGGCKQRAKCSALWRWRKSGGQQSKELEIAVGKLQTSLADVTSLCNQLQFHRVASRCPVRLMMTMMETSLSGRPARQPAPVADKSPPPGVGRDGRR